jgi:hypothetical protein
MNRARSNGRGSIRPAISWSRASAAAVSSMASVHSAGVLSTLTCTGILPGLAKWCTAPGGTATTSPGPASSRRRSTLNLIVPSSTVNRSSCSGWLWLFGTRPPGASTRSQTSASPVIRGRSKIVIRSPLSGFSMTWFGEVMVVTSRAPA